MLLASPGIISRALIGMSNMSKEERTTFKDIIRNNSEVILKNCKIVIATCNSSGMEKIRMLNIAHVIVDEATQGIEPESLIPLGQARKSITMIGDQ